MALVKRIGLTGPIGAGKSAVAGILRGLGVPVIVADELAHEGLVVLKDEVCRAFPEACPGGMPDRKRLAEVVFQDEAKRRELEAIIHPYVRRRIFEELSRLEGEGEKLVVLELPLLFETGWEEKLDGVLVVTAPREVRFSRLIKRGIPKEDAARREAAQLPPEEKAKRADWVIENTGDLAELERKVRAWLLEVRGG